MLFQDRHGFWRDAFAWRGSVTPLVAPYVVAFGLYAAAVAGVSWLVEQYCQLKFDLEIAPFELAGAALGLLLILRTNAGIDRWWEARKLWGGIVNQSRNMVVGALSYGPSDPEWRERFVKWVAVFPHIARVNLRALPPPPEVQALIGAEATARIASSSHMPSSVALQLANLLREACEKFDMDRYSFLQLDRQRAELIDHVGACERILKTPLPLVYAIKIRRFIALFLLSLPFALLHRIDGDWLVPVITAMVAYPLISLDQIGIELQNPFSKANLSHLPIGDISATIEKNLVGLLQENRGLEINPMSRGFKTPANRE